jgi:hypothetical protein
MCAGERVDLLGCSNYTKELFGVAGGAADFPLLGEMPARNVIKGGNLANFKGG